MKTIDKIKQLHEQYKQLTHASNIVIKSEKYKLTPEQKKGLKEIVEFFYKYLQKNLSIKGYSYSQISARVELLNKYYEFLHKNQYDNLFPSQSKFRPTILEEFIYLLFKDYLTDTVQKYGNLALDIVDMGSVDAYLNVFFKAKNFENFVKQPEININNKNQDFAIYRKLDLLINENKFCLNIPCVAIEVKTYIDKTMLDTIIATADKLKTGNPYTKFIAVSESYAVSEDVDPVYCIFTHRPKLCFA